jgi:hypothetical protein
MLLGLDYYWIELVHLHLVLMLHGTAHHRRPLIDNVPSKGCVLFRLPGTIVDLVQDHMCRALIGRIHTWYVQQNAPASAAKTSIAMLRISRLRFS